MEIRWGGVHPADGWVVAGAPVGIVNLDPSAVEVDIRGSEHFFLAPGERRTVVAPSAGALTIGLPATGVARNYPVVPPEAAIGEPLELEEQTTTTTTQSSRALGFFDLVWPLVGTYAVFAGLVMLYPLRAQAGLDKRRRSDEVAALAVRPARRRIADVSGARCTGCASQPCRTICPSGALSASAEDPLTIELRPSRCVSCGLCAALCPTGAVVMSWEGAQPVTFNPAG